MMGTLAGMAGSVPGLGETTIVKDIVGGFLGPIADVLKAGSGQVVPIAALTGNKDAKAMIAAQDAVAAQDAATRLELARAQALVADSPTSRLAAIAPWLGIGGVGIATALALAWAASNRNRRGKKARR